MKGNVSKSSKWVAPEPFITKRTTFVIPPKYSIPYTTMFDDGLQSITVNSDLEGYPRENRDVEHYGLCIHSPDESVPECVYSGETVDFVEIIRETIEASSGAYAYGVQVGKENTFVLTNHTNVYVIANIEETRVNEALEKSFVPRSEFEELKATVDSLK